MRYRLRTLLIVLAIGPMVLASGYWVWEQSQPQWYIKDGDSIPPPKPGYHRAVERIGQRQFRIVDVPDDSPATLNDP